tara:strand:- start:771 stop:1247 length:477 start_codon:yes stop_codon:yes gene_type:complete
MVKQKETYFLSTENNFDINQQKVIEDNKKNIVNNTDTKTINKNELSCINDEKEYIGCINKNCSSIETTNTESQEDYIFYNNLGNIKNNNTNKKPIGIGVFDSGFMNNINMSSIINFIYLFIIVLLLTSGILNKNINNLLLILIITLIYIVYNILTNKK